MREEKDRSSQWMIEHHGNAVLFLAGVRDIRAWEHQRTVLVHPRRLPDGLLRVRLAGRTEPVLFLVEVEAYPDRRLGEQVLDDVMLVRLERGVLPEVVTVILQPRGQYEQSGSHTEQSVLNHTRWQVNWTVVELWKLSARDLLATGEIGLVPWVPLTQFDEPPEVILQQCRERIDQQAPANEHANLLAVTQVFAGVRYNNATLLAILGGRQVMIQSPVLLELIAESRQQDILRFLRARFADVPPDVTLAVQAVQDKEQLNELIDWAAQCPDLEAFRGRLPGVNPAS